MITGRVGASSGTILYITISRRPSGLFLLLKWQNEHIEDGSYFHDDKEKCEQLTITSKGEN